MADWWLSQSMPCVGSGIYSSGTGGQPFNSRGVYHQNPCPEVCLFSVRPRVLRWPASDPCGVHRCQVEIVRVAPVARLIHDQRPSWGIPSFLMLDFVYQTTPDSEWFGNRLLTLMECTVG